MESIDYLGAKKELEKKNLLDIQKELTQTRQKRTAIMSMLLGALLLTLVYGLLETPFIYTLSNIGNLFDNRLFFIIWSIITGLSIQFTVVVLFKLEQYQTKYGYHYIGLSAAFLVITAIIPAIADVYKILWFVHTLTASLHALFFFLAVVPFSRWVSKENPRLRKIIYIWQIIIYGGSVSMLIVFQRGGLFELWFYVSNIIYLLFLSLVLFEEAIIKKSFKLLTDEDNLNLAIEKYFVDLENATAKQKEARNKLKKNNENEKAN